MWQVLLLAILVELPLPSRAAPHVTTTQQKCGYESCHPTKEGYINVHIVPHTHDDVGWLKTVDQYYYGSRGQTQKAGVQYILDSVVDALAKDPNRRFIYVETAFFWKWWIKQHDTVKAQVRRYVNTGRLEFIGGGWSMNDEASTHYHSIIDQMTWGLRKLNDSFGECGRPKLGWQIDPFGHSREMASIFAQLGFDGILLGRIDYQDKASRKDTKTLETVWRSSQNLGDASNIFTGVMYNTYSPPAGFCFDILCNDEPIIDDKDSFDYNVNQRVDQFFSYLDGMTKVYSTNNLIITMGEDFTYQAAELWFTNLDKLIYYANLKQKEGSKYNLIYSTPSCYVKAIHEESVRENKKWLVKTDDFFPYASDPHAYWTGYFTSRPTIKRFEREGNNYLQVCKQLYTLADLGPEDRVDLNVMREAMGVMQHHDAVSGTEKEHVAHDYARLLTRGFDECHIITNAALSQIVKKGATKSEHNIHYESNTMQFNSCPLLNVSQCSFTESRNSFVVTVYNPLSRPVSKFVRLPVTGTSYSVRGPDGKRLQTQLIPVAPSILKIPGRQSNATVELIFRAKDLPPLGFNSYYVEKTKKNIVSEPEISKDTKTDTEFEIDQKTGLLSRVHMNGRDIPLTQSFLYYEGFVGNNSVDTRSSGAYIFRPNGTAKSVSPSANISIFKGALVNEVHQVFDDWVSQIVRVYNEERYIEFDWLVGPIPIVPGKEVITRYTTPLKTNSVFYTDSNGREMLKRERNARPTWDLDVQEPIAGNYYPVTSKIVLTDGDIELAVLTDRAQGGTSLKDGEVELMLHRACLHDDAFGVGEALLEEAFGRGLVARGSHYLILGNKNSSNPDGKTAAAQERDLAQQKLLSAWTFLSETEGLTFEQYKAKYRMQFSGLKKSLPENVQILTLEPWSGYTFLLRLEHVLENKEDPNLSQPVVVNVNDIFTPFQITTIKETTLGGNQWLENNHRLHFNTSTSLGDPFGEQGTFDYSTSEANEENGHTKRAILIDASSDLDNFQISLKPMQIRTFIIEIKVNSTSYSL